MKQKLLLGIAVILLLSACVSTKKAAYFSEKQTSSIATTNLIPETIIQKNDILGISVSSANATASAMFNAPNLSFANASAASNGTALQSSGYLVDAQGNIQFPVLGSITAAGMTGDQLRVRIVKELTDRKLLIDPIISVRYLNFKVTVLGEVMHPTVVNVPSEKITLLEALGLAGDITIYGKKDNVLVIREENGAKNLARLNLNTNELFTSPYYYLKSGDIVYVEPSKAKVATSSRSSFLLPIIFSGLSFAAIVVDRISRN